MNTASNTELESSRCAAIVYGLPMEITKDDLRRLVNRTFELSKFELNKLEFGKSYGKLIDLIHPSVCELY